MKRLIEDFTPYDRSALYALNERYWSHRGVDAWTSGEVPYGATSNYPLACQHAQFMLALVERLEAEGRLAPEAPVEVLEIGGGLGLFAANFLRALEHDSGERGQRLLSRLVYHFTDFDPGLVAGAANTAELAPWVARGVVRPGRFDLRAPERVEELDGATRSVRAAALIGNYVCCVAGCKHLQLREDGWYELHIKLELECPRGEDPGGALSREEMLAYMLGLGSGVLQSRLQITHRWRALALDATLGAADAGAVEEATRGFDRAAFAYPLAFMQCLRGASTLMQAGGVALVNDYGYAQRALLRSFSALSPRFYGSAISHEVNFSLFEALGAREGWGVACTRDGLRAVHHAVIRYDERELGELGEAFAQAYIERREGEELVMFAAAARSSEGNKQYMGAAQLFRRCVELDPTNPFWYEQTAKSCLRAGGLLEARGLLLEGIELKHASRATFTALLGEVHRMLTEDEAAIRWYREALSLEETKQALTALSELYLKGGRREEAREVLTRLVAVSPNATRARAMLELIERRSK